MCSYRNGHGRTTAPQTTFLPLTHLFDNFFDFICHYCTRRMSQVVYKPKRFLLARLAALFYTSKMVTPPEIAMVS